MLQLYNSLTKEKEEFKPISNTHVGMYNCGPTVYDYAHIGNFRSYVFADILRRVLEYNGYTVNQVINITDVGHLTSDADTGEDKMTKGLAREGLPKTLEGIQKLAEKYEQAFEDDLNALNIEHPTTLPRATEHIPEQIELIKGLEKKGLTYTTDDGVYFDTSKDPRYGAFGTLTDENQARIKNNTQKRNPRDFALWKFSSPVGAQTNAEQTRNDAEKIGWDSPWGKGFPGWHLECSAMSMKYLGNHFDIHTGGIDHIPIHHTNEIAQSENYTGGTFVNHWLHNAFVTVGENNSDNTATGVKMAKSEGTGITLNDIKQKGYEPLAYRYWLLTAHYRSPITFTWEALGGAQNALGRLRNRLAEFPEGGTADSSYIEHFEDAINDDLNTPEALGLMWDLTKNVKVSSADKKATILEFDKVFGLRLDEEKEVTVPPEIHKLAQEREEARANKDWKKADELRAQIESAGFTLHDTDSGYKLDYSRSQE